MCIYVYYVYTFSGIFTFIYSYTSFFIYLYKDYVVFAPEKKNRNKK